MGYLIRISRLDARTMWTVLGFLLAAVAAGTLPPLISARPEVTLTALLLVVTPAPIVIRIVQRRFDPFEPITIVALVLFILFALRPLAELHYGIERYFVTKDIRPGFTGAATICLVGSLSIYAGYFADAGRMVAAKTRPVRDGWDAERSVRFAIRLLIVSALLTALFAATVGPGTLLRFYLGRTDTDYVTILSVSGYVSLGPTLTIPASFILLYAYRELRTFRVGALLAATTLVALYITVPRGDRTYVMALVLPLLAMYYLRRERRPSGAVIAVVLLAAVTTMNVLLASRHVERRASNPIPDIVSTAVTHPGAQLKDFVTGVDLSEFSVIELEYQATSRAQNRLQFHPGSEVLGLAGYWLPRRLVPNKPKSAGEYVAPYLFPVTAGPGGVKKRASFNAAMFGAFWADSGWISLILGGVLVGLTLRWMWEYFRLHVSNLGIQLAFAASLPLLVIMVRNGVVDTVARGLFLIGPILWCLLVCSRGDRRSRDARPDSPTAA